MGAMVSVGCKLPHGLILRMYEPVIAGQPPRQRGSDVVIAGANQNFSELAPALMNGGFGVTENVDKEFMDAWLKANAEIPAVKNAMIWIHDKASQVTAQGKMQREQKTGFEGLGRSAPGVSPIDRNDDKAD